MRIIRFRIENYRNIRLAECDNPPDFMVICGGNGCGKTALLHALMAAKELTSGYGGFALDPRAVSVAASKATVSMALEFSDEEREYVKERQWARECPPQAEIVIDIHKSGYREAVKPSPIVTRLLGWYSSQFANPPGFFDFFDAYRVPQKKVVSAWTAESVTDDQAKLSLSAQGVLKFEFTKDYLASLAIRDAQAALRAHREGRDLFPDSLEPFRDFFNRFLAPMTLKEVRVDVAPFQYIIGTPHGDIDIDDLSSGEKEVFNVYAHFHQLRPRGSVILFDEADTHLHSDLQRRYLEFLRGVAQFNQLWLTTHSPEMMMAAGIDSLYTVLREPPSPGANQFVKVSNNETLSEVLSEVMGSRGIISFNQRIIFVEGQYSSTDRDVYEHFYPPAKHNVSFVPAGNCDQVSKTAEKVSHLLSEAATFQQYYCIVDGDIACTAPSEAPLVVAGPRLFRLPVYHVENFLLEPLVILDATRSMLASECPYRNPADIEDALEEIVLGSSHLNALASALREARIARLWDEARRAARGNGGQVTPATPWPKSDDALADARRLMEDALEDGTWKKKCKGREVLKAFCGKHQFQYRFFKNLVISKLGTPPADLAVIMDKILDGGR